MTETLKSKAHPQTWTLWATLFGTTSLTAWLSSLPDGGVEPGVPESSLKYIVEPLPSGITAALGALGLCLLIVAARSIVRAIRSGGIAKAWLVLYALVGFTGVTLGWSWFCLTYGTADANIGGGMALIFGLPFTALMAGFCAFVNSVLKKDF